MVTQNNVRIDWRVQRKGMCQPELRREARLVERDRGVEPDCAVLVRLRKKTCAQS